MNNKKETVQKYGMSIVLFIVGTVIAFLILQDYKPSARIGTSFLIGWLAGGFLWGWSLTKKWFPNFSWFSNYNNNSSTAAFQGAVHTTGVGIRVMTAFFVGSVAIPVGIIITIVTSAKAGKEAYDKAYKEAVSGTESGENASTE
jgi:hypothetical protein